MASHSTTVEKIRNLFNRKARKRGRMEDAGAAVNEDGDDAEDEDKSYKQKNSLDDSIKTSQSLSRIEGTGDAASSSLLSPSLEFGRELLNAPIGTMNQKRSSFQITSVITNLEAET